MLIYFRNYYWFLGDLNWELFGIGKLSDGGGEMDAGVDGFGREF